MLSQSRGLRLALVLMMSVGYVAWHGHDHAVYAAGDDDEEGGGGDDEGGGDAAAAGKGDDAGDEDQEDDKDQPAVTSGGLYSLKTFPLRELSRPLTITEGILQAKVGVGFDLSSAAAFKSFGLSVEGKYGFKDNVMGIAGFTNAYNFKQFGVYAGVEGALAYDLIDIRAAVRFGRQADAILCDQFGGNACELDTSKMPPVPITGKPSGKYKAHKTQASIDLGFPFRYVAKPEIAIVALDTLISFDLVNAQEDLLGVDGKPVMDPKDATKTLKTGNSRTPDLNPSLGISSNPIPALSVVIFAQLQIIDFKTDKGNFRVPATARVQFSPSQKLDIGAEFTFLNVKPPEGQKFYDNRFMSLFVQFRAGK